MKKRAFVIAACAFGMACISTAAYAYSETTAVPRLTFPFNSGCIQQVSSVSHVGANDPVTLEFQAYMPGRSAQDNVRCAHDWPAGSGSWLVMQPAEYLIKLNNTNDASQGYFICAQPTLPQQFLVSNIDFVTTYPQAPCGAGYYALVACINSSTSYTSTPSGTITGTYAANPWFPALTCNVSPMYHPIGVGDNVTAGPQVVL
jgi:hypothetical protein